MCFGGVPWEGGLKEGAGSSNTAVHPSGHNKHTHIHTYTQTLTHTNKNEAPHYTQVGTYLTCSQAHLTHTHTHIRTPITHLSMGREERAGAPIHTPLNTYTSWAHAHTHTHTHTYKHTYTKSTHIYTQSFNREGKGADI